MIGRASALAARLPRVLVTMVAVGAFACPDASNQEPPPIEDVDRVEGSQRRENRRSKREADRRANPVYEALVPTDEGRTAMLSELGYVTGAVEARRPDLSGVIRHDTDNAEPGVNLYSSRATDTVLLMDMAGVELHRWKSEPGLRYAILLEDGDLLVMGRAGLSHLDSASAVRWRTEGVFHHDFDRGADGVIWALTESGVDRATIHPSLPVLDNQLVQIDRSGRILQRLSLLDLLSASPYAFLLVALTDEESKIRSARGIDLLHANHVEILDGRLAERWAPFAAGNLLVSARHLNAVFIVDPTAREIVWLWGPNNLVMPHHPTALPNGHIMVFDNRTEASRVVELDPIRKSLVWTYEARGFHTTRQGSASRLANGNTLITESDRGRAIEVTSEGEIVWEFLNPAMHDPTHRKEIFRVDRYDGSHAAFVDRSH